MDSLSLQLTGGPQGYRVNLKNMEIFGASNFTVKTIKYVKHIVIYTYTVCFWYFLCSILPQITEQKLTSYIAWIIFHLIYNLDWAKIIGHLKHALAFHDLRFVPNTLAPVCYSSFQLAVQVILMVFSMVLSPISKDKFPHLKNPDKLTCMSIAWHWNWMWRKCACTSLKCSKIIAFWVSWANV